jgi:hypothetical protein
MVNIPEERIEDFRLRWREAYDDELSFEDARAKVTELVELFLMIGRSQGKRSAPRESVGYGETPPSPEAHQTQLPLFE